MFPCITWCSRMRATGSRGPRASSSPTRQSTASSTATSSATAASRSSTEDLGIRGAPGRSTHARAAMVERVERLGEQAAQLAALVGRQAHQRLVLELAQLVVGVVESDDAFVGDRDVVLAPVVRISDARDVATLLELVEPRDHRVLCRLHRAAQLELRLRPLMAKRGKHRDLL